MPTMQARYVLLTGVIALAMAAAAPVAQAKKGYHKTYRTAVTVYPRDRFGRDNGFGSGPGGYPAHQVPLAAYTNPTGMGITFGPFGWDGAR
jgi:hypothetical protein